MSFSLPVVAVRTAMRRTLPAAGLSLGLCMFAAAAPAVSSFKVEEATISDIQSAILKKRLTATEVVTLYLQRIKAFNGPGVEEPQGILGPTRTLAHANGVNALGTLNLRPAARKQWGFDDRKARSMTDALDADPAMPDALEAAARLDATFKKTGKLVGPLHGVVIAIKDQYDTFDMRTTSGADAAYANDRPPRDANFIKKLRAAGAIIIGKANMGEYASGFRSAFGGTIVNPYDTERVPAGSSGGSAVAVATNMATVGIAEESGPSIRAPAQYANLVGISPTQELVSRVGLFNMGLNTRTGPVARTVADAARVMSVIAGYDPEDEMTAFAYGRTPGKPYESFTRFKSLKGVRIGVVREYMDKTVFAGPEYQSNIALTEQAINDLKKLGATIVEPPAEGLFTAAIKRFYPMLINTRWTSTHPELFAMDDKGKPAKDHTSLLIEMRLNPARMPDHFTLRDIKPAAIEGESRYGFNLYLAERGDANIKTIDDLIAKSKFFVDPNEGDKKLTLQRNNQAMTYDNSARLQLRYAIQQIVMQTMAQYQLDAVVYPTSLLPPRKINTPRDPSFNGIGNYGMWTFLGVQGLPAITVPAGFTTEVWDRVPDPAAPVITSADDGSVIQAYKVVGPVKAKLPVGVDFLGVPFSEPTLLKIAAAYESVTHHRQMPADFGVLK